MTRRRIFVLIVALLAVSILAGACDSFGDAETAVPEPTTAPSAEGKILWIDSYHAEYDGVIAMNSGMEAALVDSNVELRIAHLDSKNVTDAEQLEANAAEIKAEIDAFQPDVIIATDDNAQKYVVVPYALNETYPVVFAGINWDISAYGFPAPNVTGMIEIDLGNALVDILSNYTNGEKIGYVAIDSTTEQKTSTWYNDLFFDGEMTVNLVPTFEELKTAFLAMQEEADVIIVGNNAGAQDWDDDEARTWFIENTTVPTGSVQSWMVPYVLVVLGKNPAEWGQWTAETALDILSGSSPDDIAITQNSQGMLVLNLDMAEVIDVAFIPTHLANAEIYTAIEE